MKQSVACVILVLLIPGVAFRRVDDVTHLTEESVSTEPDDIDFDEMGEEMVAIDVDKLADKLKSGLGILASAVKKRLPEVEVVVGDLAHAAVNKAKVIGIRVAKELGGKMCDEETRRQIGAAAALLEDKVEQAVALAVERWPAARDDVLKPFAQKTVAMTYALEKQLRASIQDGAQRREVKKLIASIQQHSKAIQEMVTSKVKPSEKHLQQIKDFATEISALTEKAAQYVKDVHSRDDVQQALSLVREHFWQLAAAMASKWPDVQAVMMKLASEAGSAVKGYTDQLLAAVNLCDPEVRSRAVKALEVLVERIQWIVQALQKHWPTVKLKLHDIKDTLSDFVKMLRAKVSALIDHPSNSHEEEINKNLVELETHLDGDGADAAKASSNAEALKKGISMFLVEAPLQAGSCVEAGVKFWPLNMKGGPGRVDVTSMEECQALCDKTRDCATFTYWPNGGCHLQDKDAKKHRARRVVMAGQKQCE